MFNFYRLFLGISLYYKYMFGRRFKYKTNPPVGSTIGFGPHVFSYPDYKERLQSLKDIGIGEVHKYWTFSTDYFDIYNASTPEITRRDLEQIQAVRDVGLKLTAQIRWNPTRESLSLPKDYPFWWWSGFVNLPDYQMSEFAEMNIEFIKELHEKVHPDEIIISNESGQLIHLPEDGWIKIARAAMENDTKVTVALNTWQPLKYDKYILRFIRGMNMERVMRWLFQLIKLPYPGSVRMDFNRLLAKLPQWLALLDSVGVNSYHYPTFNKKSSYRIGRLYAPFGADIKSMSREIKNSITCTETGLELESGVDRSLPTAVKWWGSTFDFWFFGMRAKRVLVWEHDMDFFMEIVEELGGLDRWVRK